MRSYNEGEALPLQYTATDTQANMWHNITVSELAERESAFLCPVCSEGGNDGLVVMVMVVVVVVVGGCSHLPLAR